MISASRLVDAAGVAADDSIELDYDRRHRRRMTMTARSGKEFLLDLKSATALQDGDLLALDDGTVVQVRAKAERVADIFASGDANLVRIAWHLGNRHLPVQVLQDRLRIRDDRVIVDMVRGLGATVEVVEAPFQPERGAYAHGHDH